MPFAIRDAVPTDAPAIAEVHVEAWRTAYRGIVPDDFLRAITVEQRLELWQRYLADPSKGALVVEEEERVVGFASFGPAADDALGSETGELFGIYLLPSAVGRGIGRELLARATTRLRDDGHARAILWVFEENARARRFYEIAGWRCEGTTAMFAVGEDGRPVVRYALDRL